MADGVRMPRSGVWHFRSKTDPRWNRTGQYSSLVDDPPRATPTEAREALDELRSSFGESPPADLNCTFLPYPGPKLERLFAQHVFTAVENQSVFQVLSEESGLSEVSLNQDIGELSFGKPGQPATHHLPAQFLGLLAEEPAYWQWAWVFEERGSTSPQVLKSAQVLRDFGRQHEIPELTYAEIALGQPGDRPWFNGDYLALVARHICRADFFIARPAPVVPGLVEYWLVTAPGLLPTPPSEARRIALVIQQAVAHWAPALRGTRGRDVVRAYADQKGCRVSEIGDRRLRLDTPSGEFLFIDFDEAGGIYGIELSPDRQPEPAKASWLGRLFRGKA
jgi:hypothetical protein